MLLSAFIVKQCHHTKGYHEGGTSCVGACGSDSDYVEVVQDQSVINLNSVLEVLTAGTTSFERSHVSKISTVCWSRRKWSR